MIAAADVQRLRAVCAPEPSVLSLYMWLPTDLPALRGSPARADELIAQAAAGADVRQTAGARSEQRRTVRKLLEVHGRHWLGHTIAMFTAGDMGLAEAFPLPGRFGDQAVLATRPHVRPLLVALQRGPVYHVAVLDWQHAWVFRVSGSRIDAMVASAEPGMRSSGFGGWYGLESHRISQRITGLAHHHFADTAASMKQAVQASGRQPLVLGGREDTIPTFLAVLPDDLGDRFAGSFVADPSTMTPGRIRELSDAVVQNWVSLCEQRAIKQIRAESRDGLTAVGLRSCLSAVNARAVQTLVVPAAGLIPGFACELCGTLASTPSGCPHGTMAAHPVPDLLEEMVAATLDDAAEVQAVRDPPGGVAALLRFPRANNDAVPDGER